MNDFLVLCLVIVAIVIFMVVVVYLVEQTMFPLIIIGLLCVIFGILSSWRDSRKNKRGGQEREWDRN